MHAPKDQSVGRRGRKRDGLVGLLVVLCCNQAVAAHRLSIHRLADGQTQLQWSAEAIAPLADVPIQLDYQIEQSSDLIGWIAADKGFTITDPTVDSSGSVPLPPTQESRYFRAQGSLNGEAARLRSQDLAFGNLSELHMAEKELSFSQMFLTDFSRATLSGAFLFAVSGELSSFEAADLSGADLTASEIIRSNFDAARITRATARFARFTHSSFQNADLRFVDFTGTDLFNCDLRGADLRGTILLNTDLRFVRFHGSRIDQLNRIPEKDLLIWQIVNEGRPDSNLVRKDLSSADLSNANLRNASLLASILSNSDLRGADLRGADLTDVRSGRIDLRGSRIDETSVLPDRLQVIWDIVNTQQEPKRIPVRVLSNAVLSGGHLEGFTLRGFNFSESAMIGINLKHADLRNTNLSGAFLRDADLRHADLRNARITNTDFTGALFEETIMPDGTVQGP